MHNNILKSIDFSQLFAIKNQKFPMSFALFRRITSSHNIHKFQNLSQDLVTLRKQLIFRYLSIYLTKNPNKKIEAAILAC